MPAQRIIPDTGDFETATSLHVWRTDRAGVDWSAYLSRALPGDALLLLVNNSRTRFYHYDVIAWPIVDPEHVTLPVRFIERQGASVTGLDDLLPNLEMRATVPFGACIFGGAPNAFSLGTGWTTITNYPEVHSKGTMIGQHNAATGVITIPHDDYYQVSTWIYGNQGDDTKEQVIRLGVRVANAPPGQNFVQDGDYVVDLFDVATDKTYERTLSGSFTVELGEGSDISMIMNASASMGTFTPIGSDFGVIDL